jgi:hypothetical protein
MEDELKKEIKEAVKNRYGHGHHGRGDEHYEMDEFEKYMAMSWGSPQAVAILLFSLAGFLLSIGIFFWLLHVANIIH